jgi:restriction system protein
LQAVIVPERETAEGTLIEAVALPWFDIIEVMQKDPASIWQLDWRKWEEIIAGAHKRQGSAVDVTLTPRSNDKGRDVIVTTRGFGCIRYVDQVKHYAPDRRVSPAEVRELIGVLALDPNASKGIMTTTADFAPGIENEEAISKWMPYRLELKPRAKLLEWLASLARKPS